MPYTVWEYLGLNILPHALYSLGPVGGPGPYPSDMYTRDDTLTVDVSCCRDTFAAVSNPG